MRDQILCEKAPFESLPAWLPDGAVVTSRDCGRPIMWVSNETGPAMGRWWDRLFPEHPESGLYPLLVNDCLDVHLMLTSPSAEGDIDAIPGDRLIRDYFEYFGDAWPGFTPAKRPSVHPGYAAGRLASEGPADYRLALVPCARGADAPALIGWAGAINYTRKVEMVSSVLRSWEERFGVRVVKIGCSTLELSVAAPPVTMPEARRITLEHAGFCPSIWSDDVTVESYAAGLVGKSAWRFRWA
ncbi:DUF4253 domain-containing protein [Nocardia alni]|uniref:DUF4253 domain-containing protein n=1 Tax=Nocardia alni TaxID=2815723 RepID=UPI001C22A400|nr:DUF4253 domain-containing protein [Nocardia alni]